MVDPTPTPNISFGQKFKDAIADPKVIVVLLGMLASVSAWGGSLLMEVGELRASDEIVKTQLTNLQELHADEMDKMHELLGTILNKCGGS